MPSFPVGSSSFNQDGHATDLAREDARIVARCEQAVLVQRADGSRLLVPVDAVTPTADGRCRLDLDLAALPAVATDEAVIIPVIEETLHLDKRVIKTGGVRITKTLHEWIETVDEPLLKEEVTIERRPVERLLDGDEPAARYEGETLVISVVEEVLTVQKRRLLREEVRITRRARQTRQPQEVTLRREQVTVERFEQPRQPGADPKP